MTTEVGFTGYQPVVTMGVAPAPAITEQEKYQKMWEFEQYRTVAPGEACATEFMMQVRPKPGSKVIDLGCGTGRGGLTLAVLGGMDVTLVDFTTNSLDADIAPILEAQPHAIRFVQQDLTKKLDVSAEYGFCTDVLEHIPTEDVDKVLDNTLQACQHVFYQISTVDDVCGALIGHPLHLTVKPYEWWLAKFKERDCVVHWSKDLGNAVMFYVTAWQDSQAIVDVGVLNTAEETVKNNVRANINGSFGEQQVTPHAANDLECMILGGGPTLDAHLEEIKELRAAGAKLITLNGAYNWAIENGLTPSAQIMVDARDFNARFTKPVSPTTKYLIASQCHPSVLEGLPPENTYLWHTSSELVKDILDERYPLWYRVPGGSTVLLRAIPLMRMLGYKKFHLFGCDSCIMDAKHHSYAQVENDGDLVIPVTVGNRVFKCNAWMVAQAHEFMSLVKFLGHEIDLEIHGDGLLKHILVTGAALAVEDEWLK